MISARNPSHAPDDRRRARRWRSAFTAGKAATRVAHLRARFASDRLKSARRRRNCCRGRGRSFRNLQPNTRRPSCRAHSTGVSSRGGEGEHSRARVVRRAREARPRVQTMLPAKASRLGARHGRDFGRWRPVSGATPSAALNSVEQRLGDACLGLSRPAASGSSRPSPAQTSAHAPAPRRPPPLAGPAASERAQGE